MELKQEAVDPETGATAEEVHRVVEEEEQPTETSKYRDAFAGSNLFDLYGYSPYNINSSLKAMLIEKEKRTNRKRSFVKRNLLIDEDFYKNNKKMTVTQ